MGAIQNSVNQMLGSVAAAATGVAHEKEKVEGTLSRAKLADTVQQAEVTKAEERVQEAIGNQQTKVAEEKSALRDQKNAVADVAAALGDSNIKTDAAAQEALTPAMTAAANKMIDAKDAVNSYTGTDEKQKGKLMDDLSAAQKAYETLFRKGQALSDIRDRVNAAHRAVAAAGHKIGKANAALTVEQTKGAAVKADLGKAETAAKKWGIK